LIKFAEKTLRSDALGAIIVQVPYVPIPIHVEWCEWCADIEEEEDENTHTGDRD